MTKYHDLKAEQGWGSSAFVLEIFRDLCCTRVPMSEATFLSNQHGSVVPLSSVGFYLLLTSVCCVRKLK